MTMTVYTVSGAPRAWRVLLGLTIKGLDYNLTILEASKKEHKSAEFLKMNPRGTVPVLDADGLILRDSLGILAWLDRRYPEHPLFGKTPTEAAHIWQITLESCDYLRAATNEVFHPLLVGGKPAPEPGSEAAIAMATSVQKLKDECQRLENLLEAHPYLAGDTPSAADAVSFPDIRLIERAITTKSADMDAVGLADTASQFPKLEAWKARIGQFPNFEKTMPPHWASPQRKAV